MERHRGHRRAPATVSPNPSRRKEQTHFWRVKLAGFWLRGALGAPRHIDLAGLWLAEDAQPAEEGQRDADDREPNSAGNISCSAIQAAGEIRRCAKENDHRDQNHHGAATALNSIYSADSYRLHNCHRPSPFLSRFGARPARATSENFPRTNAVRSRPPYRAQGSWRTPSFVEASASLPSKNRSGKRFSLLAEKC